MLGTERGGEWPGEGNLQPEAFVADVFGAVRSLGRVEPIERLELKVVGMSEFEEMEQNLRDMEVINRSETGLTANREMQVRLVSGLTESENLRHDLYSRILTPIPLDGAVESGENIFAVPGEEEVFLLFLFP